MATTNSSLETAYRNFIKIYRGRDDCAAVKKAGAYSKVPGGLTFERFREHVTLVNTYAIYQMDPAGNVSFCLYDLDVLPRKQEWRILKDKIVLEKEKTLRVIRTLASLGIQRENILMEFPTVGYHLILYFTRPVSAMKVKRFVESTLEQSGLAETPFYPRSVEAGTTGDRIQLPFRMNTNTGRRANLISDLVSFDPENYDPVPDFSPLERVRPVEARLIETFA
ncbi:MAG: hypothetical protein P1P89_06740 [Desulfobacterales bacterium]|nr:hypothetical protein [Desulfobacterales bacterium]